MPTRYLKPGIRDSERIESLSSPDAEILYYRLIVSVDDFGRTDARPLMLKSLCFPIRLRATADKCMQWTQDLVKAGLISVYEVDGKPYLQITKWDNKPRAERSKYPNPRTDVYSCPQMLPVTVNREPLTDNRKPEPLTGTETGVEARATRLPKTWTLPAEWMDWAGEERGWSASKILKVSDLFRDYWIAKPGKDGRKLDWEATWRNWVRNQNDKKTSSNSNDEAIAQAKKELFGEKDITHDTKRV